MQDFPPIPDEIEAIRIQSLNFFFFFGPRYNMHNTVMSAMLQISEINIGVWINSAER